MLSLVSNDLRRVTGLYLGTALVYVYAYIQISILMCGRVAKGEHPGISPNEVHSLGLFQRM